MTENQSGTDDYDSPWKEGMEIYFKELIEFFFPAIASEIDWNKGYQFLDKEFQSIVRDAEIGRRYADKLVSVWSLPGEKFHVMIHIEIQSDKDIDFPKRMYIYNYRIFDKSYLPVTSLAILADENALWKPDSFGYEQWGCKINFQFPMIKLINYKDKISNLLNQKNPFAIITAAHLMTKATKGDPQSRYSWKWTITTTLYEKGFSKKDIMNIYRLVDWLMMLPDDLTKKFNENLITYEEKKKMPYVTSAERIGIEKGIEKGMEKGIEKGMLSDAREMVIEALDIKFSNNVPGDVHKKINALNNRILLKKLLGSAIQSKDIDDFRKTIQDLTPEQMQ